MNPDEAQKLHDLAVTFLKNCLTQLEWDDYKITSHTINQGETHYAESVGIRVSDHITFFISRDVTKNGNIK